MLPKCCKQRVSLLKLCLIGILFAFVIVIFSVCFFFGFLIVTPILKGGGIVKILSVFLEKVLFLQLILLLITGSAHAVTYNFDDGTNQGWTVEFNTGGGDVAASWFDYVNYTGTTTDGRPPVIGPADPDDNDGAIMGSGPVNSLSLFSSPVFTSELIQDISVQFSVSTGEGGIPDATEIFARVGYHNVDTDSLWWGSDFNLNRDPIGFGSSYPLWTEATVSAASDGDLIDQIFVVIGVDRYCFT